jgi:hypothetical protein
MVDYYLESLQENNAVIWENFNNTSPEGSFFHSLKWKQIAENTSNIRTQYFLLFKDAGIFGIFPFVERKIHFFNGLVPMPGFGHNNAIILDYLDASAIHYILKEFQKLTIHHRKISFICLSTLHKETLENIKDYPMYPYKNDGNIILDIRQSSPDKIWDTFSAKKGQRKFIRRFDEQGFRVTELHSYDDLKLFYKYYKENIDFIGGRLQAFSHFDLLWHTLSLSDEMRITLLSKDSTVAGGVLMFTHKPQKTVYLQYLSLNRSLPNTYHPSYYLFWEAITWAWKNNYEKISFGVQNLNEDNPRYRVKTELGGNFEPLHSKMIALSHSFAAGHTLNQYITRIRHL